MNIVTGNEKLQRAQEENEAEIAYLRRGLGECADELEKEAV